MLSHALPSFTPSVSLLGLKGQHRDMCSGDLMGTLSFSPPAFVLTSFSSLVIICSPTTPIPSSGLCGFAGWTVKTGTYDKGGASRSPFWQGRDVPISSCAWPLNLHLGALFLAGGGGHCGTFRGGALVEEVVTGDGLWVFLSWPNF